MKTFIIMVFLMAGGTTSHTVEAFDREEAVDWVRPLYADDDSVRIV